jgi:hypothetical protein
MAAFWGSVKLLNLALIDGPFAYSGHVIAGAPVTDRHSTKRRLNAVR